MNSAERIITGIINGVIHNPLEHIARRLSIDPEDYKRVEEKIYEDLLGQPYDIHDAIIGVVAVTIV